MKEATHKWRYKIDARHVVYVVYLHLAMDPLLSARLNAGLEDVRVVEVLHCFRTQIDAQVLKLARLETNNVWKVNNYYLKPGIDELVFILQF